VLVAARWDGPDGCAPRHAEPAHTEGVILGLFEELHDLGVTIVVITHDRDIAARLGRRIEMLDGKVSYDSDQHSSSPSPTRHSGNPSHNKAHRP
jgi:ABC-type polar amino acid transport system ATPase subunit